MIPVYGINYLTKGELNYGDIKNEVIVATVSLTMTMATMFKKLKDDVTSNYWKQQRQINSRRKN
jgi:hypothetical protein